MFEKILIANRGEIAVRIIRTLREMGIPSVAVYSEADRESLHVRLADEAVPVGPASPTESYLVPERLLEAAERAGADAVHPGYGFLSENADFCEAVEDAGLTFIGPPSEAIRLMGDKVAARRVAEENGVPLLPGKVDPIRSAEEARAIAEEIGYPVLLKARSGGGGKGIRVVRKAEELAGALNRASSEAKTAFGDADVYLERYLEGARHIEIQILADSEGNAIHLGERECSLQRRHQKLLEESPSVVMTPDLRQEMGAAAVRLSEAIGYTNAGTVEFLYADGEFYFMEMNTRLQVEHPVTEWGLGIDLVREQVRVAAGRPLTIEQERTRFRGAAIEVRVYAEDPTNRFVPSTGRVHSLVIPAGPYVRVDTDLYEGMEVTLHYDPMIAKVIAWGQTREEATQRVDRALREMHVGGVKTTNSLTRRLLRTEAFRTGDFDIHFLERFAAEPSPGVETNGQDPLLLGAILHHHLQRQKSNPSRESETGSSCRGSWRWGKRPGWRP